MRELPGLSVEDSRAEESGGATVTFKVTLSDVATEQVTVDYGTRDGTARGGEDYAATSGTLSFAPGESSRTIEVDVLDDRHDEGEEWFVLALSNPTGARLEDAEATGTIENADALPAALIARFGRATAEHVVEHVADRMARPRTPGIRARFAGQDIGRRNDGDRALALLTGLGQAFGAGTGPTQPWTLDTSTAALGVRGTTTGGRTWEPGHAVGDRYFTHTGLPGHDPAQGLGVRAEPRTGRKRILGVEPQRAVELRTFRSGERIRLGFEPNIDGFLYVVQRGSTGQWLVLLPHPEINDGRNAVAEFEEVTIPPQGWFRFDDNPGTEQVFVYLSREPIEALPGGTGRVVQPHSADEHTISVLAGSVRTRDLVFEKDAAPEGPDQAAYVVNHRRAGGAVAWTVELEHR